ncbi:VPA1351 family putative T3SS effector [Vibrio parahaemolyticus]|uniref:VPA1351 family putative T3SS effector n=1 Tax=Vibrio parahaemolyticus TaxID=670 RepID=UPI001E642976|nr:VPA1351 family putative T3SS effector [Vibrio parahaemolyticus]
MRAMWLLEFFSGCVKGVTLPIENKLVLVGREDAKEDNIIPLAEFLTPEERIELEEQSGKVQAVGLSKKKVTLVENKIYRYRGLTFCVYRQGKGNPSLKYFHLRQFQPLLIVTVAVHLLLAVGGFSLNDAIQKQQFGDYLQAIGNGYIKDGQLYTSKYSELSRLPEQWSNFIQSLNEENYLQATQFNLELVSAYSGKPLQGEITSLPNRDQIRVETFELDNQVMATLGKHAISFYKQGANWFVSDPARAKQVLTDAGLSQTVSSLKSRADGADLISDAEFPYSIFYTSHSGRYLYDELGRYWEGSEVPELGVIQEIREDRVVFFDGKQTRAYLIQVK